MSKEEEYNPQDTWEELKTIRTEVRNLKERLTSTLSDPVAAINNSEEDPWLTESQRKEKRAERIRSATAEINKQIGEIKAMEDKLATIVYWVKVSDDEDMQNELNKVYDTIGQMVGRKEEQLASLDNEMASETLAEREG